MSWPPSTSSGQERPWKRTRFSLSPSNDVRLVGPVDNVGTSQAAVLAPSEATVSTQSSSHPKRTFSQMDDSLTEIPCAPTASAHADQAHPPASPSSDSSSDSSNEAPISAASPRFVAGKSQTLRPGSWVGADDYIRLTMQTLRELGLERSVAALESEAGIAAEPSSIPLFRTSVLAGRWHHAKRVLKQALKHYVTLHTNTASITDQHTAVDASPQRLEDADMLYHPAAPRYCTFSRTEPASQLPSKFAAAMRNPSRRGWPYIKSLIYHQRYLELIEAGERKRAMFVLRSRMMPLLGSDHQQIRWCSSLLLCTTPEQLRAKADHWEGTGVASRERVLKQIEGVLSPSVILPSHRMDRLLEQALEYQRCGSPQSPLPAPANRILSLYIDGDGQGRNIPDRCLQVLGTSNNFNKHDEMWVVTFSPNGQWLACGGSGKLVALYLLETGKYTFIGHLGPYETGVSALAWSPDSERLVVGCDPEMYLYRLPRTLNFSGKRLSPPHDYTVSAIVWLPSGKGFITGGQDSKLIFWDSEGTNLALWSLDPFRILGVDISKDETRLVVSGFSHTGPPGSRINLVDDMWRQYMEPKLPNGEPLLAKHSSSSPASEESHVPETIDFATESDCMGYGFESFPFGSDPVLPIPPSTSAPPSSTSREAPPGYLSTTPPQAPGTSPRYDHQRHKLFIIDLTNRRPGARLYLDGEVGNVRFSSDSRYVLSSHMDNSARLWYIGSHGTNQPMQLVATYHGHTSGRHQVQGCFGGSEEQYIIMGSEDTRVHIYHRYTGHHLGSLVGHQSGTVNSVAWHPTVFPLIASGGDDGTVRLWAPEDQNPLQAAPIQGTFDSTVCIVRKMTAAFPLTDSLPQTSSTSEYAPPPEPASNPTFPLVSWQPVGFEEDPSTEDSDLQSSSSAFNSSVISDA